MAVDLHPENEEAGVDERSQPKIHLKAVPFYNDFEHNTEPILEGVRLVLQYDVCVADKSSRPSTPDPDFEDDEETFLDVLVLHPSMGSDDRHEKLQAPSGLPKESSLSALVNVFHEIIDNGTEEIGIPLRHLYCQANVRKEYHKGIDGVIAILGEVFKVEYPRRNYRGR
ncbi:hypothetical protein IW261DRAFT_1596762 [Armillaria novae-zelandiae]|uniref:Uncharacterized protein n=1 Tax=Armillaria novae-zelandiae TaxID=153914 RepID=A0AA39NVI2_9AGAR|nr:hypothetical protein IW261DRAFT_1596762 [Armillaria novae-zelandiae]